jgi:nucleoside 2-deoxyribosyltransferase
MVDENPQRKSAGATPSRNENRRKKPDHRKTENAKKLAKTGLKPSKNRAKRVERPFPRVVLQEAIKVPLAIRHKNGGNPWPPDQVAEAVGYGKGTSSFYYLTASSRDFGLTEGTRDTPEIALTDLGRRLAYAETPEQEVETRQEAFLRIDLFREVLDYYKGSQLPEMNYLRNTLENKFKLDPTIHEEFADLFRKNCEFVGIQEGIADRGGAPVKRPATLKSVTDVATIGISEFVTVAEPDEDTGLLCFVAMPFDERHAEHPPGFFKEVLRQIIAPAGKKAGFRVVTARKQGSDVIHATIVNGLLDADLVVADLTEHNPNVLFELGVRMAEDKPVALIRATGTKPIFDVDNMLRVEDYNPCLWSSTVEVDMPKISAHIKAAWDSRDGTQTYMKILRNKRAVDT